MGVHGSHGGIGNPSIVTKGFLLGWDHMKSGAIRSYVALHATQDGEAKSVGAPWHYRTGASLSILRPPVKTSEGLCPTDLTGDRKRKGRVIFPTPPFPFEDIPGTRYM